MVAHGVPLGCHAAHKVRVFFNIGCHNKKSAGGVVLFQRVQNGRHIAVFIAAVERQVQPLLACAAAVIGAVLRKLSG